MFCNEKIWPRPGANCRKLLTFGNCLLALAPVSLMPKQAASRLMNPGCALVRGWLLIVNDPPSHVSQTAEVAGSPGTKARAGKQAGRLGIHVAFVLPSAAEKGLSALSRGCNWLL